MSYRLQYIYLPASYLNKGRAIFAVEKGPFPWWIFYSLRLRPADSPLGIFSFDAGLIYCAAILTSGLNGLYVSYISRKKEKVRMSYFDERKAVITWSITRICSLMRGQSIWGFQDAPVFVAVTFWDASRQQVFALLLVYCGFLYTGADIRSGCAVLFSKAAATAPTISSSEQDTTDTESQSQPQPGMTWHRGN